MLPSQDSWQLFTFDHLSTDDSADLDIHLYGAGGIADNAIGDIIYFDNLSIQ